jgi:hypothetical protein
MNWQPAFPNDLEQETNCIHCLSIGEIGARGQVDSLGDSIFDCFADRHFMRLESFPGHSIGELSAALCLNDSFEEPQLEIGHVRDQNFHTF